MVAIRSRRKSSAQGAAALKGLYARILTKFRSRRLRSGRSSSKPTRQSQEHVLCLGILKTSFVARDRKSLLGLVVILDADMLPELTDDNPSLLLMKLALISYDYEGFSRIDAYLKSFWQA